MTVKYRLQRFGPSKGKWWFRIVHKRTRSLDEVAQNIGRATSLSDIDVLAAADALTNEIKAALTQGESVRIDGLGTFKLSASGLADDHDAQLDTQQLDIVFSPNQRLRRHVRNHAERERVIPRQRAPEPQQFTDSASERHDAYTAGRIGKLYGHTLKLDPNDPQQGVFFVGQDGSEMRVSIYAHLGDRWLYFGIPDELTGPQRIIVRAKPRFASDLRQGRLNQELMEI